MEAVLRVVISSDHAGYNLKQEIINNLKDRFEIVEFGACNSCEAFSYAKAAETLSKYINDNTDCKGILICGTGVGISMTANKIPGIRAALCCNEYMARMSVEHNNANVLVLGARVIGEKLALSIVDAFFNAEFQAGRHLERINEMERIEKENHNG